MVTPIMAMTLGTPVENSEAQKAPDRSGNEACQRRALGDAARKRSHNASKLYTKRCRLTKERATALYRVLNYYQIELEQQGTESWLLLKNHQGGKSRGRCRDRGIPKTAMESLRDQ